MIFFFEKQKSQKKFLLCVNPKWIEPYDMCVCVCVIAFVAYHTHTQILSTSFL